MITTVKDLIAELQKHKNTQTVLATFPADVTGQEALRITNVDFVEQLNAVMIFTERIK